jgi:hypothetical protein
LQFHYSWTIPANIKNRKKQQIQPTGNKEYKQGIVKIRYAVLWTLAGAGAGTFAGARAGIKFRLRLQVKLM